MWTTRLQERSRKQRMKVNVPIVSVISPMYQAARFIDATIESVLGQSYQSWEHILIDDCSSDGTAEIVRRYADRDPRLRLLSNSNNLGPSGSRNKGIRAARGRYLAFLDSDDLWEIEKLKEQIGFMTESDLALTYTACTENKRTRRSYRRIGSTTTRQLPYDAVYESHSLLLGGIR